MAAIMQTIVAVPKEITEFFQTLYHAEPQVTQDKKNTVYSIAGKGISISTDPYGGCHILASEIPFERIPFVQGVIQKLADHLAVTRLFDSLWIDTKLPCQASDLFGIAPAVFQAGRPGVSDVIYDYQQKMMRSWVWLNSDKECSIPAGATHNIGATAIMIDRIAQKVLLVVNINRSSAWNLPGGSYEPADNAPCHTALREAQEEGGFEISKQSLTEPVLISQMQFPYNQFAPAINQTWAFFADGISHIKLNPPVHEIIRAEWIDISSVIESDGKLDGLEIGEHIKASINAAIKGVFLEKIIDKGWMVSHAPKFT